MKNAFGMPAVSFVVTEDNQAARFNERKPMFSFIDFTMWEGMFDEFNTEYKSVTIDQLQHDILMIVSEIVKIDDRTVQLRTLLNELKIVSYILSLLYRGLPIEKNNGLPDLRAFEEMSYVLEFGSKKYARDNWRKGYANKYSAADSLLRHLQKLIIGETHDKESGLHHIGHLMCNVMFLTNDLLYVERKKV